MVGFIGFSKHSKIDVMLPKSPGMSHSFDTTEKPIPLLNSKKKIENIDKKFPSGETKIPFSFQLLPNPSTSQEARLYDSYHGVHINICYFIVCEVQRSLLSRNIQEQLEFLVETTRDFHPSNVGLPFILNENTVWENTKPSISLDLIPKFCIEGRISTSVCDLRHPFTGSFEIKHSSKPIKSVEVQLIRIETCSFIEGNTREASEIQNLQIAEGDVARNVEIPIFMMFPRLFTCTTILEKIFKIEFEINFLVLFSDNLVVSENFPLRLMRTQGKCVWA
eukprot:Sdes_comp16104_c0_seq1m5321